jgi:hypothetical protein
LQWSRSLISVFRMALTTNLNIINRLGVVTQTLQTYTEVGTRAQELHDSTL